MPNFNKNCRRGTPDTLSFCESNCSGSSRQVKHLKSYLHVDLWVTCVQGSPAVALLTGLANQTMFPGLTHL